MALVASIQTARPRRRDDPPVSPPTDDYLAPIEAARLLRVSPRTVLRWVRAGRIPHELSPSGAPRVGRQHVLRLIHPPGDGAADDER
jgi:hypothetical protein